MQPSDYLRALRRRWPLVVCLAFVGAILAWVTTPAKPPPPRTVTSYSAVHTLLLDATSPTTGLDRMAFFTTTGEVPKRVAAKIGDGQSPALLASQVRAEANTTIGILNIAASNPDPKRAELLANTFASELVSYLNEQSQDTWQLSLDATATRIDDLQRRKDALDRKIAGEGSSPNQLDVAQRDGLVRLYGVVYERYQQLAQTEPSSSGLLTLQTGTAIPTATQTGFQAPRSRGARVPLAALAGAVIGAGLSLLLERLDNRVRTKDTAEQVTGLPVLAEIPALPRSHRNTRTVVTVTHPASMVAESYRILRTSLLLMDPTMAQPDMPMTRSPMDRQNGPRVILVTSPGPGEGKTSTAANLAACFAEAGKSVLVLSCDFRRPRIHEYLGTPPAPGMSDAVGGAIDARVLRQLAQPTTVPGVMLVPSGPLLDNPAELVAKERSLVNAARELADIVIVDTTPVLAATDASELMPAADAIVLVCRAGKTTKDAAYRTTELLARLGAPVFGVTLIGATQPRTSKRYYYGYTPHAPEGVPLERDEHLNQSGDNGSNGDGLGRLRTKPVTREASSFRPTEPGDDDGPDGGDRPRGRRRGLWFG